MYIYRNCSRREQNLNKIVTKMIKKGILTVVVGGFRWFQVVLGHSLF